MHMDPSSRVDQELLSADDVAQYLKLEPVTIYRWCRDGRLPCMKLGKVWRIRHSALDAFLRQAEQPRTLVAHLGAFLELPDQVLAVPENADLLTRLDAAFLQVGKSRGGRLVKLYEPQQQWQLLGSLRGVIRLSQTGSMLSRVVGAPA
jgi:excisionase family DNA binding protein